MIKITGVNKINNCASTTIREKDNVSYITYKSLDEFEWLTNAFSTRIGGISEGIYADMNLSFTVGDEPRTVYENFKLFGRAIDVDVNDMVYSHQTHTTNVMRVSLEQAGMGISKSRDFHDIDGIMTNDKNLCLVTSYADCVPLYFVDPVNKAIALSHSGWRGTVRNICKNTVEMMKVEFGTKPENIVACIGPSICVDCYEVSRDVADKFTESYDKIQIKDILYPKSEEKYQLDLHMANYYNMVNCGIKAENISMPDICTSCNSSWLHSHRKSGGKRGGLCAFLMIKQ